MALSRRQDVGPFDLTISNYGSLTHEVFLNVYSEDYNPVGYVEFANMSGNGQLDASISFAAQSTAHDIWTNTLTFDTISATSAAAHAFYETTDELVQPILPSCRVRVTAKAKTAGSVTFSDIIASLFTEK